jgi:large subunit ribosomal protein L30
MTAKKTVKVKLVKSTIGRLEAHKACVRGLGLKKIHQTVTLEDTPAVRGMINKVNYMVEVVA